MKRGVTGHYVPLPSAAGEDDRAFVPNPLPLLEFGADIRKLSQHAIQTIGKASGSALRVHRLLQAQPILSIATAGEESKLSVPTVISALNHLAKLGIARETTGRNYGRIYAYDKYLKILNEGAEPLD